MKKIFTLSILTYSIICIASIILFAQDTTGINLNSGYMHPWIGGAAIAAAIIWEMITRGTPTNKDFSIINFIARLVDKTLPNHAKDKGRPGYIFRQKKTPYPEYNEHEKEN